MKYLLTVCAAVKNEGSYLLEWIAHYKVLGVDNILIYDNESDDETGAILTALEQSGIVTRVNWPTVEGTSPQLSAFNDAVDRLKGELRYIAFFDADEFLCPIGALSIKEFLNSLDESVGAIAINQRVFGSSGRQKREPGLVIERFKLRADNYYDENKFFKTIAKVSFINYVGDPHYVDMDRGIYVDTRKEQVLISDNHKGMSQNVCAENFFLNHYILKSREEFEIKRTRGGGAAANLEQRRSRYKDDSFFVGRDIFINTHTCTEMDRFIPAVKEEIGCLAAIISLNAAKSEDEKKKDERA